MQFSNLRFCYWKEKLSRLATIDIANTFDEESERSALAKITKVAFSYEGVRGFLNPGVSILNAFKDPIYLTPNEFREQVKRNFELNLTPMESAALVNYFDDDSK